MDIENTPNDDLGQPGAMPGIGGSVAADPPPIPEGGLEVTTVSLVSDALQAPESEAPTLNRDGSIRKKPGRKPGQKNGEGVQAASGVAPKVVQVKTPAQVKAQQLSTDQTARMILKTIEGALVEGIGAEWAIESQAEADTLRIAVGGYIDAKGGANLSPETMLLLAVSGYGLPRLKHENTRAKLKGFFVGAWKAITGAFRR